MGQVRAVPRKNSKPVMGTAEQQPNFTPESPAPPQQQGPLEEDVRDIKQNVRLVEILFEKLPDTPDTFYTPCIHMTALPTEGGRVSLWRG